MNWLYDLGDAWTHVITLESVADPASSTGAAALLDGGGACPPEDSNGLDGMGVISGWSKLLTVAVKADSGDRAAARKLAEARAAAATTLNYSGHENRRSLAAYPLGFDLDEARHRLTAALASRLSTQRGVSRYVMPTDPSARGLQEALTSLGLGGTTPSARTEVRATAPGMFLAESKRMEVHPSAQALCARCGSPANLKRCGKCRAVRYCSMECARAAWKAGHKQECGKTT